VIVPSVSLSVLVRTVRKLASERLTSKQKLIVCHIENNKPNSNVTKLVLQLAEELGCSKSTIWNNLNSLKRAGLVSYSSASNKGRRIMLTKVGKLITEVKTWQ